MWIKGGKKDDNSFYHNNDLLFCQKDEMVYPSLSF